ncbi:MAG: TIGR00730 family Rossman fold protein [Patescibacteria group bacterium]
MNIGITLTSALDVGEEYIDLTEKVATKLAINGHGIVYGGTAYGMMSTLASAYKAAGGQSLTGVMAKDLMAVTKGYIAFDNLDTSFLEETMENRKHRIVEQSDAFILLPGGYGTFEEIGSIVGGKVNKLYDKPIALYNYDGFYDTLIAFLDEMQSKAFSKIPITEFVFISDDLDEILNHFTTYQQKELVDKFV